MKTHILKSTILLSTLFLLITSITVTAAPKKNKGSSKTSTPATATSTTKGTTQPAAAKFQKPKESYKNGQEIIDFITRNKNFGSDKFSKFYILIDDGKGNIGSKIITNDQAIIDTIKNITGKIALKYDKDRISGILEKTKFDLSTKTTTAYDGITYDGKTKTAKDALFILIRYFEIPYQGKTLKIYLNDPAIGNGPIALASFFSAK